MGEYDGFPGHMDRLDIWPLSGVSNKVPGASMEGEEHLRDGKIRLLKKDDRRMKGEDVWNERDLNKEHAN